MDLPYRGAAISILLIILLLTPPDAVFEREGAFVDSRPDLRTASAQSVGLDDGLRGDVAGVLPSDFPSWRGVDDESWDDRLSEVLQYDQLLVRDYHRDDVLLPVQLMVLTARHGSAFHDPEVCFTAQGGNVEHLEPTTARVPGTEHDLPVGRMLITYENEDETYRPAKLVYNLFVVETLASAPDRTTWIRMTIGGVVPDDFASYEPLLQNLLTQVVPYMFHGTGETSTTFHWLSSVAGTPVAIAAAGLAFVPVVVEVAVRGRRLDRRE